MTVRAFLVIACLALAGIASPASAKIDVDGEIRHIRAGETVQLRPDRAYLLLRIDTTRAPLGPAILRVPGREEIDAYEAARQAAYAKAGKKAGPLESFSFDYDGRPNLFLLVPKWAFASLGKTVAVLVELTPGDYVIYGTGGTYECLCLGTVGFAASAGRITDLGTMISDRAWEPSAFPELAGEVDLGRSAVMDYGLYATAVRPLRPGDFLPAGLDPGQVSAARFHAVGPFVEPNTMLINRLAPIPGVLAYDKGRVIDVATGTEALPN
jgi:hypothetical protein